MIQYFKAGDRVIYIEQGSGKRIHGTVIEVWRQKQPDDSYPREQVHYVIQLDDQPNYIDVIGHEWLERE